MGFHAGFVRPHHLDEIFDAFVAFKNVRNLGFTPFATHFVNPDLSLTSRYFAHFQPTLRSLELLTPTNNPKDLIAFIAFFPFLGQVTFDLCRLVVEVEDSRFGELDPNQLNPFRGTLRMYDV